MGFFSLIPSHTRGANILAGPKVQIQNEIEAFELFFFYKHATEDYEVYNKHGNDYSKTYNWKDLDQTEIKAFLGLLILIGVTKGNHENLCNLWCSRPLSQPVLKAVMSVNKFEQILKHLRFDNLDAIAERRDSDKKLLAKL